jgi:hypothetical protein
MREETIRLATIAVATATGEGSVVSTQIANAGNSRQDPTGTSERVRLFLNVTALTAGSTPTADVTVVHTIDTIDFIVGTFTQNAAGVSSETIVVEACPSDLMVKYTIGGTTVDFSATVDCMRF